MQTLRPWLYGTTGVVVMFVTLFTTTYIFTPSAWTYFAEFLWLLA